MKHTIEKKSGDHYLLDDTIDIKWVNNLGGDDGWAIIDGDKFYQKPYATFETALTIAMGQQCRGKEVFTPPAGD